MIKILGAIDIFAGALILFNLSGYLPLRIVLIFGIIILFKASLSLFKDVASWIDLIAGALILTSLVIEVPFFVRIIASILILQKGIISFF